MIFASLRKLSTRFPYFTNVVVYSSLYTGAEFCQQVYKIKFAEVKGQEGIDRGALTKCAILGSAVFPNILYLWYKSLDASFPGAATSAVLKKVFLDVFLLTPVNIFIFYSAYNLLDGNFADPFSEAKVKLWPTFKVGIMFWIPAQTINFYLVPPAFRVAYVGCCMFVWANVLCNLKKQPLMLTQ